MDAGLGSGPGNRAELRPTPPDSCRPRLLGSGAGKTKIVNRERGLRSGFNFQPWARWDCWGKQRCRENPRLGGSGTGPSCGGTAATRSWECPPAAFWTDPKRIPATNGFPGRAVTHQLCSLPELIFPPSFSLTEPWLSAEELEAGLGKAELPRICRSSGMETTRGRLLFPGCHLKSILSWHGGRVYSDPSPSTATGVRGVGDQGPA